MAVGLAERYEEERQKRQQASKGLAQFLDKEKSSAFLVQDPWIEAGTPVTRPIPDGGHVRLIVFGTGFAGLLAAIKAIETGAVKGPEEVLMVDPSGGFGGTWYWNRYPGLMCDVESYTYLPLLEETGYIPKRRFAGGEEIRNYFNVMAKHWNLENRAQFQSAGTTLKWENDRWSCEILEHPKGLQTQTFNVTADFVVLGSGGFTYPKMPNVPGLESFKGQMLHTGRWNYDITGGTSANPTLDKLKGKRVAIVGTGATAIQVVPELAKHAGELYVFQRTPSAVDARGNRDTNEDDFKRLANGKGWHKDRMEKLQMFIEQSHDLPEGVIDANDGFSALHTMRGAAGGPSDVKPEDVAKHIAVLEAEDAVRSERVRARTFEIVKDPETAKKLQAWYPQWCKRACFHDEYLPSFNLPNVHLVDTEGKGISALTPTSIQVNGEDYPVDIIVWSTGYGNPFTESLAGKAGMAIKGKDGQDMEELYQQMSLETLHGLMATGFPNLFLTALSQAGIGANQVQRLADQGLHNGYIIAEAQSKVGESKKPVIEATKEACEKWGDELAGAAHLTAAMLTCTPGYFTMEGDAANIPPQVLGKMARNGIYGQGYMKYAKTLERWREGGDLKGVEIKAA